MNLNTYICSIHFKYTVQISMLYLKIKELYYLLHIVNQYTREGTPQSTNKKVQPMWSLIILVKMN